MPEATEIHHQVPRRLLAAHDRIRAHTVLNGEALQLWFGYEGLLLKFGLDPDISREELEQAIKASAVEVSYEEHRSRIHALDWPRWGRKGGLATLERYGRIWFVHLARKRWRKITAEDLRRAAGACDRAVGEVA